MIDTSHHGALPIHRFCPLRVQVSPSRLAVVVSPPLVHEPSRGSVRPKQPIFSQRATGGSPFCVCASDPLAQIEHLARRLCTPKNVQNEASTRASSMAT